MLSLEAPLSRPGTKEAGLVLRYSHADDDDIGRFFDAVTKCLRKISFKKERHIFAQWV